MKWHDGRAQDDTFGFRRSPRTVESVHSLSQVDEPAYLRRLLHRDPQMDGLPVSLAEDEAYVREQRRRREEELNAERERLRALEMTHRVAEQEEEVRLARQQERLERQAQLDAEAAEAADYAAEVHERAEAEYDFALEEQEREYREQHQRETQREFERERRIRAAYYEGSSGRAGAAPIPAGAPLRRGAPLRSAPRRVAHTRVSDMDTNSMMLAGDAASRIALSPQLHGPELEPEP